MRSTIIISQRGEGYISTVSGKFGGGHQGARCGLTPYEAAASAARFMIEYALHNPDGGDLMAPPEVMELVPEHLRSIAGKPHAAESSVKRVTIGGESISRVERTYYLTEQYGEPGLSSDGPGQKVIVSMPNLFVGSEQERDLWIRDEVLEILGIAT